MAEEPAQHEEELQAAQEPEETPGYKPPAKKTLEEIKNLDDDDESLKKYKAQLLKGAEEAGDPSKPPEMKPIKMTLISEGQEDREVDLIDLEALKKHSFVIKDGVEFKLKITFTVQNEIVCGLRYIQHTSRKGINVDKQKIMMGSYGPKKEEQEYTTPVQDAPKGMVGRGSYTIKSKFADDDKNEYAAWTWHIDVKKEWE